ncbi:MAG: nitrous oxide reductase accessory protein NosL [Thauera sp.]|nr:nitrous oxide reductase accessory protein NosL [Thauera sp.]
MCTHLHCLSRRRLLLVSVAGGLLAACGQDDGGKAAAVALETGPGTSCALDGMLLADYPGPKAQIHYRDVADPDWFCDTIEMFSIYLKPEQVRAVSALYVQDMGKTDWDKPVGHWIDAKRAIYVLGSKRLGSMGATAAAFSAEADAKAFAERYGGTVLRFDEVTPDKVMLDGGTLHDQSM